MYIVKDIYIYATYIPNKEYVHILHIYMHNQGYALVEYKHHEEHLQI